MTRRGLMAAAGLACALAVPIPAQAATSLPVGSTQTTLAFCSGGAAGTTNPGTTAPSGCQGGSGATVTMCKDDDLHAFVQTQIMSGGKRPALTALPATALVRLQSNEYGMNQNVDTFATTGTALAQIGAVPPGTYNAAATLWAGTMTNADGTTTSYPSSSMSMTLVVQDSPCGGTTTSTSTSSKGGCGVGDKNHDHEADAGKSCPTK